MFADSAVNLNETILDFNAERLDNKISLSLHDIATNMSMSFDDDDDQSKDVRSVSCGGEDWGELSMSSTLTEKISNGKWGDPKDKRLNFARSRGKDNTMSLDLSWRDVMGKENSLSSIDTNMSTVEKNSDDKRLSEKEKWRKFMMKRTKSSGWVHKSPKEEDKRRKIMYKIDKMHANALEVRVQAMNLRYQRFKKASSKQSSSKQPKQTEFHGCVGKFKENTNWSSSSRRSANYGCARSLLDMTNKKEEEDTPILNIVISPTLRRRKSIMDMMKLDSERSKQQLRKQRQPSFVDDIFSKYHFKRDDTCSTLSLTCSSSESEDESVSDLDISMSISDDFDDSMRSYDSCSTMMEKNMMYSHRNRYGLEKSSGRGENFFLSTR